MDGKPLPEIESSRLDTAISIAKGLVGALPYGGSLFAEIIGMTIPNQRLDRITHFLVELDSRLDAVEREGLKANQYAIDLFEDGVVQASRALTEDRNRYIAALLKKSIGVDRDSYGIKKKLIYILQELSDKDIEILRAISAHSYQYAAQALYPGHLTVGQYDKLSEEEKYEYNSRKVSFDAHISTLERLGLLEAIRERPGIDYTNSHIDEKTGLPRIVRFDMSALGKVFLYSIKD